MFAPQSTYLFQRFCIFQHLINAVYESLYKTIFACEISISHTFKTNTDNMKIFRKPQPVFFRKIVTVTRKTTTTERKPTPELVLLWILCHHPCTISLKFRKSPCHVLQVYSKKDFFKKRLPGKSAASISAISSRILLVLNSMCSAIKEPSSCFFNSETGSEWYQNTPDYTQLLYQNTASSVHS